MDRLCSFVTLDENLRLRGRWTTIILVLFLLQGSDSSIRIMGPAFFITDGTRTLTLRCVATHAPPGTVFGWSPAYIQCEESARDQGNCTFSPGLQRDNTTLYCTVTTPGGQASVANYTLNLKYPPSSPPEITSSTPGQVLTDGDHVNCTVKGGKPSASLAFNCSNPDLEGEPSGTGGSSTVTVNISRATEGGMTCTCRATWDPEPDLYTDSKQTTYLTEFGAFLKEFTVNGLLAFTVRENDTDVVFQCQGLGLPSPRMTLTFSSAVETEEDLVQTNASSSLNFTLTSVTRYDMGRYLCLADNGIREADSLHIQLYVLCAPVLEGEASSIETSARLTEDGVSFNLTSFPVPETFCYTYYGTDGNQSEMVAPNKFVMAAKSVENTIFVFCNLTSVELDALDPGYYSVNISNGLGELLYYFHVEDELQTINVTIMGPDVFLTDGSLYLTLRCVVTDAPPGITYLWTPSTIICEEKGNDRENCSFAPSPEQDNAAIFCTVTTSSGETAVANFTLRVQAIDLTPDPSPRPTEGAGKLDLVIIVGPVAAALVVVVVVVGIVIIHRRKMKTRHAESSSTNPAQDQTSRSDQHTPASPQQREPSPRSHRDDVTGTRAAMRDHQLQTTAVKQVRPQQEQSSVETNSPTNDIYEDLSRRQERDLNVYTELQAFHILKGKGSSSK